jgi:hypothetical protein
LSTSVSRIAQSFPLRTCDAEFTDQFLRLASLKLTCQRVSLGKFRIRAMKPNRMHAVASRGGVTRDLAPRQAVRCRNRIECTRKRLDISKGLRLRLRSFAARRMSTKRSIAINPPERRIASISARTQRLERQARVMSFVRTPRTILTSTTAGKRLTVKSMLPKTTTSKAA